MRQSDDKSSRDVEQEVHRSVEADFADAFGEVARAAENLDFDAHEQNGQVASIDLGKAHGVLLRGDDYLSLPLLAAIDAVEDFLLGEAVMVGEAPAVDELGVLRDQAPPKALGKRDAAERGDLLALQEANLLSFAGENVFEIEGVVDALDDGRLGIVFGNPCA